MRRPKTRNLIRWITYCFLAFFLLFTILFPDIAKRGIRRLFRNRQSVNTVMEKYQKKVRKNLANNFVNANIPYPGKKLLLLVNKDKLTLKLFAADKKEFHLIKTYPVLAQSGTGGPKLREGDLQIPEGIYKIELLNPQSSYHLSMRLNYPNEFD